MGHPYVLGFGHQLGGPLDTSDGEGVAGNEVVEVAIPTALLILDPVGIGTEAMEMVEAINVGGGEAEPGMAGVLHRDRRSEQLAGAEGGAGTTHKIGVAQGRLGVPDLPWLFREFNFQDKYRRRESIRMQHSLGGWLEA